jgi:hypothetical protein
MGKVMKTFVKLLILFPIIMISFSIHREYRVSKPSFVPFLRWRKIDETLRKRLLFLLNPLRNLSFVSHAEMKIVSCIYERSLFVLVVTDNNFIEIVDIKTSIFYRLILYYSVMEEEKLYLDDKTYPYTLVRIEKDIHNVKGRIRLEEVQQKGCLKKGCPLEYRLRKLGWFEEKWTFMRQPYLFSLDHNLHRCSDA